MGREIDIFDGPLTDDDRAYLEARNRTAEIEANDLHYGTKAAEDKRKTDELEAARKEAEAKGQEFVPEDADPEDDPDDVLAVQELKYDQLQKWLKEQVPPLDASGKKPELQRRVLDKLREIRAAEEDEQLADD